MSEDFVSEIRPRVHSPQPYTPAYSSNDFVAEIRPMRFNNSEFRQRNNPCHAEEASDQDLMNILSGGHFSREDITRVLRGSIPTLVEKFLTGRSLCRVEGHVVVSFSSNELPIVVNFNQTYYENRSPGNFDSVDQSLRDSFNVKVKNGDLGNCPINDESFGATSPLHEFEREQCNSLVETDDRSSLHSEYHRDGDSSASSPLRSFGFSTSVSLPRQTEPRAQFQDKCPVPEPKFENHRRHDSDDESGYTSNEKEDSETNCELPGGASSSSSPQKLYSTFNDYYCSGFDGKNTLYTPFDNQTPVTKSNNEWQYSSVASKDGSNEMDDEEDDNDFNHRLVIDESSTKEMGAKDKTNVCRSEIKFCKEFSQSMEIDTDDMPVINDINRNGAEEDLYYKDRVQRCLNEETDDGDLPNSSDITDTDVPVDFSGDSNLTHDVVSAIPHPQSLVSKHPEGFRCKQCSNILKDASAVSEHVLTHHDLHCCKVCCRTFTAKNNLKRHIRIHTGQRPYKCTQCLQSFARRDDLKDHMLRHEYSNPFRCSVCKRGYTDRACVKNHMAKEHRSRLMHVCPQCGESYDEEEAFAAHKRTHPELQQFSCNTCSFIGNNNQMIQKHALLHTHKLFSCKPCNAYFADPFDYTNHIRKHKKTPSFSQYVCCFCDITIPTYDQYIRHEYSHTQGKTHSCKTCKKLFKSKSLLQDHAIIHQDLELNKAETLQGCPEPTEFNESNSMLWQPNVVQDNIFFSPNTESRFPVDSNSLLSSSDTVSSTYQEEDCDEFQGQLLDLSMKKPQSPILSQNQSRDDDKNFSCGLKETGISDKNFPRNVVVLSESCFLGKGHEDKEHTFRASQGMRTGGRQEGRSNSLQDNIMDSSMNSEWNNNHSADGPTCPSSLNTTSAWGSNSLYLKPLLSARLKSIEWDKDVEHSSSDKPVRRILDRSTSQEYSNKASFRFSPYTREKFADLAAKFVAARGSKIFHQRTPLQTVVPTWQNRQETINLRKEYDQTNQNSSMAPLRCKLVCTSKNMNNCIPMLPMALPSIDQSIASFTELKTCHEISREESNPETALRCHAPVLVKSEPLLENVLDNKDARLQSLRDECGNIDGCNVLNNRSSTPFECGDCMQWFGSFSELESHSVEMHKRYLCEHCKKSFTARPNRDRHVRYHTGERPYKCDLCDLAFFRGDDLKYHRTTRHPTAQPFICSRCDASFAWGRDLDRHIRHSKCKP